MSAEKPFFKRIFNRAEDTLASLTRSDEVKHWLEEIGEAGKREEFWRKEAQRTVEIYEGAKADENGGATNDFNILYANTETMAPAVYNSTPTPRVKRRFVTGNDRNPIALAATTVVQRALSYLVDPNNPNATPFDELNSRAVREALVPGRGQVRYCYDAEMAENKDLPPDDKGAYPEKVSSETIYGKVVPWNRFRHGYAITWAKVPWVGYEHFMTKAECVKNFGHEIGEKIRFTAVAEDSDKTEKHPADSEGVKFAHIWEILDKTTKKVLFISEGYPTIIKSVDDPWQFDGFFDCPKPLSFLTRISSMTPQVIYLMYERQAKELNDVTRRIGKITNALKVRGFYDGTLEGLDNLLSKDDNTLIPTPNIAAFQQGQTLEKSIWLMPLDKLIQVLQQLYANRTQVMQVIYQITGLADIMRGASQASETLGAQQIKQAWGTLRLKDSQKEVQRFVRDSLRLMTQLVPKLGYETLAKMTAVQLPTNEQKAQAQQAMQQAQEQFQQQAAMAQQQPPAPGQPPAPPPQFQPPPELAEILQKPSWEDVIELLSDDILANFLIDIETDSTIEAEATEDKKDAQEFMTAMSQLMQGLQPMVTEGILPFAAAKSLLLAVVSKFRFGDDVEEVLQQMSEPPKKGPQDDPKVQMEAAKAKAEMDQMQQVNQMTLAQMGEDAKLAQAQNQLKMQQLQADGEELARRTQLDQARFNAEMAQLQSKTQIAQTSAVVAQEVGQARVDAANAPKPAPTGE